MDLNSIKYRDDVNNTLKAAGILKPMVATVGISQLKQNIVITTTHNYTVDQLLTKKPIYCCRERVRMIVRLRENSQHQKNQPLLIKKLLLATLCN